MNEKELLDLAVSENRAQKAMNKEYLEQHREQRRRQIEESKQEQRAERAHWSQVRQSETVVRYDTM